MRTKLSSIVVTVLALATCLLAVGTTSAPGASATTQAKELDPGQSAWYPRVIRLEHADAAHNGRIIAVTHTNGTGTFYESTNNGASFQRIGQVQTNPGQGNFSCCGTLFEFPRQLGNSPAGTLLWAVSVNTVGGGETEPNPNPKIIGWKSHDYGRTWVPLPNDIVNEPNNDGHGLWEPEFSVDAEGKLVAHFSDKTQQYRTPAYGQTIAAVRSVDGGDTWGERKNTVAIPYTGSLDNAASPGMPVVRKLPNGTYIMTYELCNITAAAPSNHGCRVYYRTSPNGWEWGGPYQHTIAKTPDGKHLAHAPTVAWTPGGGPNGRILLIGRLVRTSDADTGPATVLEKESGTTILANTSNGLGRWYEIDAPVRIQNLLPDAGTCQNYSSPLLPSADGSGVLQLATDWNDTENRCAAHFAGGPTLGSGDASGLNPANTYHVRNLKSALCLVDGGSSKVTQDGCPTARVWQPVDRGSGYFSLRHVPSGQCLDVPNGNISIEPGDLMQLWPCNQTTAQNWKPHKVGRNAYLLKAQKNENLCLDVPNGAMATGVQVQVTDCNRLGPQIWHFDAT